MSLLAVSSLPGTELRVPQPIRRAARWVWSRRWPRRFVIAAVVWHLIGLVLTLVAPLANAADDTKNTGSVTNILGWMNIYDSHRIPAADMYLSIDGGGMMHPMKTTWAFLMTVEYETYRGIVMTAIWIISEALKFKWLQLIAKPVQEIGGAVADLTSRVHVTSLMMMLAGAAVALWIMRGRYATGLYELMVSMLVAAGLFGFLAHPVQNLIGDHGALMKTHNMSMQVAEGIANHGNTDGGNNTDANSDQLVDHLTGHLVDTFIREPTQLITFGKVLDQQPDGGACARAFDEGMRPPAPGPTGAGHGGAGQDDGAGHGGADPHADSPTGSGHGGDDGTAHLRDVVGDTSKCPHGDQAQNYAENPGAEGAFAALFLIPAGFLVLAFGLVLAGRCVLAACWALFNGIKLIPGAILGIAPMFRGQLVRALADIAVALLQVAFAIISTVAYCVLVTSLFDNSNGLISTVLIVDILLLIALVMFIRGMRRLHQWSDKLADIMRRRPGGSPSPVTVNQRGMPATELMAKARAARGAYHGAKRIASATGTVASATAGMASGGTTAAATKAVQAARSAKNATQAASNLAGTNKGAQSGATSTAAGTPTTGAPSSGQSQPLPDHLRNPDGRREPLAAAQTLANMSPQAQAAALRDRTRQGQNRAGNSNTVMSTSTQPPVAGSRGRTPGAEPRTDARSTKEKVHDLASGRDQRDQKIRSTQNGPTRSPRPDSTPAASQPNTPPRDQLAPSQPARRAPATPPKQPAARTGTGGPQPVQMRK